MAHVHGHCSLLFKSAGHYDLNSPVTQICSELKIRHIQCTDMFLLLHVNICFRYSLDLPKFLHLYLCSLLPEMSLKEQTIVTAPLVYFLISECSFIRKHR